MKWTNTLLGALALTALLAMVLAAYQALDQTAARQLALNRAGQRMAAFSAGPASAAANMRAESAPSAQ